MAPLSALVERDVRLLAGKRRRRAGDGAELRRDVDPRESVNGMDVGKGRAR